MKQTVWIADGGIRLSAVLERPHAGRCPLMIVLHGFTSTKDKPHNVAVSAAMREAGVATLRVDLYGHGKSGGSFRTHTIPKWISNTLAAMDAAERLDFVDGIWLSGHSQGGLTAALVAGLVPERVRGLVLRAPAFMIPAGCRAGELLGERFDPVNVPDRIRTFDGRTLDGAYLREAQTLRVEEAIDRFPGPVLLLHGDEDDLVPPQDSVEAARRYRNCRLEILPGESHHFDRHPERANALIRRWLRDAAGEASPASEGKENSP